MKRNYKNLGETEKYRALTNEISNMPFSFLYDGKEYSGFSSEYFTLTSKDISRSKDKEKVLILNNFTLSIDLEAGEISSLVLGGCERINSRVPLFSVRLRDTDGNLVTLSAYDAESCVLTENGAIYGNFCRGLSCAQVFVEDEGGDAALRIALTPQNDRYCVESVDFPTVNLPTLQENDSERGGKILFPYNEGVIVSDIDRREGSWLKHADAEYPSKGNYPVFPNMLSSQMLAYLWEDVGLYLGAHDEKRGVKEISFFKEKGGVTLRFRIFCGVNFDLANTAIYVDRVVAIADD